MGRMVSVEIECCEPCGSLDTAIATQRELLETCEARLDGVRLKTGDGGVFSVAAEDEVGFDDAEHGTEIQLEAIVGAVAEQVPGEA